MNSEIDGRLSGSDVGEVDNLKRSGLEERVGIWEFCGLRDEYRAYKYNRRYFDPGDWEGIDKVDARRTVVL